MEENNQTPPQSPVPEQNPIIPTPPPVQKPNFKLLIVAVVVVILLIASSVSAFYLLPKQAKVQPKSVEQIVPTQSPSPTLNPTVNWKTYTNSQYGISFKYPNYLRECCAISISPNEGTSKNTIVKPITLGEVGENELGSGRRFNGLVVGIDTNTSNESFLNYFNEQKQELKNVTNQDSTESNVKVGILSGKMLQNYSPFGGTILYASFPNSKNVLVIGKTEASEGSFKDFDQILSTFKFTN